MRMPDKGQEIISPGPSLPDFKENCQRRQGTNTARNPISFVFINVAFPFDLFSRSKVPVKPPVLSYAQPRIVLSSPGPSHHSQTFPSTSYNPNLFGAWVLPTAAVPSASVLLTTLSLDSVPS